MTGTATKPKKADPLAQLLRDRLYEAKGREDAAWTAYYHSPESAKPTYSPYTIGEEGPMVRAYSDAIHATAGAYAKRSDYIRTQWENRGREWPPAFPLSLESAGVSR